MLGLSAANLLELTDQADGLDWVGRGLLLSEYAWPDSSVEDRRSLPVGVRDRLIMALRVATFGRTLDLRTRCQACGAELEAALDAAVMLDGSGGIAAAPTSVTIEFDGERYEVRLPSTDDLLSTAGVAAPEAEWALLERCCTRKLPGRSERFRDAAAGALEAADPMARIDLELHCSQCGIASAALLDIVSFFWTEIVSGARRIASEVHALASAYGWSEREILSLAPARRRRYLALVLA